MRNLFKNIFTLVVIFRFFESINRLNFVLIRKSSTFPNIKQGSDLDILTTNIQLIENEINKFLTKYKKINLKTIYKSSNHCHFDLFFGKVFIIKLDIFTPGFNLNEIENSEKFLEQILSKKEIYNFRFLLNDYKVFIPSDLDEVILRYLEFHKNPYKIHHKEYVNSQKNLIFTEINKRYSQFLKKPIKKIP